MSMLSKETKTKGGSRKGSGRKSREELGMEPCVTTSLRVEASVIDKCKKQHGSLANALRFASKWRSVPDNGIVDVWVDNYKKVFGDLE